MGLLYSSRRALLGGAEKEITWLLRDDFTTDLAAGNVHGTAAEPGPGTRALVDPTPAAYISGGELWMPADANDIRLHYNDAAYAPGSTAGRITYSSLKSKGNLQCYWGWDNAATGDMNRWSFRLHPVVSTIYLNGAGRARAGPTVNTDGAIYQIWLVPRSTGCHFFIGGEGRAYPTLVYANRKDAFPANLNWLGINQVVAGNTFNILTYRQADDDWLWLPAPIASDSFDRANGAMGNTDGAGHQESGAVPLMGGGGDGVAWTNSVGTTVISGNEASASALVGGLALATVDAGVPDVTIVCEYDTLAGGNIGVAFRYTDSNNYAVAYIGGGNIVVDEVVGGVLNNLSTKAHAYGANSDMCVCVIGQHVFTAGRNTYGTDVLNLDASLTGTRVGLYSTNTGNFHDDFVCFPAGGDNEYSVLEDYAA